MAIREFTAKLSPTRQVRKWSSQSSVSFFLTTQFKVSTLLVGGALLQLVFLIALPIQLAMVPTCLLVLHSAVSTLIQCGWKSLKPDSFIRYVVPGRTSSQIPSKTNGKHTEPGADLPIVVFLVGIQFNHPLGFFSPGAQQAITYFKEMIKELKENREQYGVISVSNDWKALDRDSHNTLLNVSYFTDVESLHRFARGPIHEKAWEWYRPKRMPHIGVYHETFVVPRQGYETIYVNCHPTLLGRGSLKCETEDGEMYVNTLVSADTPALKSMYSRLGRAEKDVDVRTY